MVLIRINKLDSNVTSNNLGPDCLDKISFSANGNQNSEHKTTLDNNTETNMEWTTVRPKKIRVRSNSNDSEKIKIDITVSPSKKQKSHNKDVKTTGNGNTDNNRKQGQGQSGQNARTNQELGIGTHSIRIQY